MRSESTSALGQPRDTKPTAGMAAAGRRCAAVRSGLSFFVLVLGAVIRRRLRCSGLACLARAAARETGEREIAEQVAGLLLQLLLHFHEGIGALLEIAAHQPLDRRPLHLDEFVPGLGAEHRVAAVHLPRLLL